MDKVEVDFAACKECGYCKAVCPQNVFEKGPDFNDKGFRAYVAVNSDKCVECARCFYVCPDFAISLLKLEKAGGGHYEKNF